MNFRKEKQYGLGPNPGFCKNYLQGTGNPVLEGTGYVFSNKIKKTKIILIRLKTCVKL